MLYILLGGLVLIFITAITTSLIWSLSKNNENSSSNPPNDNAVSCPASNFPLNYQPYYQTQTMEKKLNQQSILIQNGVLWTGTGKATRPKFIQTSFSFFKLIFILFKTRSNINWL